ncbi:TetR/AcrR family transcriptional regulator [Kutzneria buriramensis]|uniref:TetR/AcrR family transcriptional regulator n=1 Tax=Kutzneria buriramensis TaxID=1045776 RepID=UPI001FECD9E3|nr:TetR/AcrR family transcriptional regulator [Kutzneria buriramensis]
MEVTVPDRRNSILDAAVRVIARAGVRGLRVEELAAEAGVSMALIYYHFGDRAGLLRRTLEHINDRAASYTRKPAGPDPRREVERLLLLELQDTDEVRVNSTAWGELRATAVFDDDLREPLAASTKVWVDEIAAAITRAQRAGSVSGNVRPAEAADLLTALVEGLSDRWLSGSMTLARARRLLRGAIAAELD